MSRIHQYRESVIGLSYESMKARVLETAFELNLFELIGSATKTASTLAGALGAHRDSLELFLNALVSLGFLASSGNGYSNTKYGLELFIKGKDLYVGDILGLQARSSEDWLQLKKSVLSGKPIDRPEFFKVENSEMVRNFALAMHNTAIGHAGTLAKKLSLREAKTLLDLGGGPGTFTVHFLKENPGLRATIFDLPGTLETTRPLIQDAGLTGRVDFQAGDFNRDEIKGKFDACFLSHIIHGQDEEKNKKLFVKIFNALHPDGKLIVQDFFLNADKKSPQFPALFALNMLIHTEGGKSYSFEECESWMKSAGFLTVNRTHLNLPRSISLVIAHK